MFTMFRCESWREKVGCDPRRIPEMLAKLEDLGILSRSYTPLGPGHGVVVEVHRPWALWSMIPPKLRNWSAATEYKRALEKGMRFPPHPLLQKKEASGDPADSEDPAINFYECRPPAAANASLYDAGLELKALSRAAPPKAEISRSWATARQTLEPWKAIRAYLRLLRLMAWEKGLDFPAVKTLTSAAGKTIRIIGAAKKRVYALENICGAASQMTGEGLRQLAVGDGEGFNPWPRLWKTMREWSEQPCNVRLRHEVINLPTAKLEAIRNEVLGRSKPKQFELPLDKLEIRSPDQGRMPFNLGAWVDRMRSKENLAPLR